MSIVDSEPADFQGCELACTHDLVGGVKIDELRNGDGPYPNYWEAQPPTALALIYGARPRERNRHDDPRGQPLRDLG